MNLTHAVVHYINKMRTPEDSNIPSTLQLRQRLLPVNEKLAELLSRLRQIYNGRTGRGYGVFHQNQDAYPFSAQLGGHEAPNWEFLEFTHRAMGFLKVKIDGVTFATGGYMLFAAYEEAGERFLLVASLKNRPGYMFNEELDLTDHEHVDLDNLHEMARINLTAWTDGRDKYVSFAKRRSTGEDFTKYFREFIGCDEFTESRVLTANLLKALHAYSELEGTTLEERQRRRQVVFDYCDEKRVHGERVSLRALSGRLDENSAEAFLEFVNQNERFGVSDDFDPDRNIYRGLRRFKGNDKRLTIAFDADQLGNRVIYNQENQTLLVNDIPANLRQQLDSQ